MQINISESEIWLIKEMFILIKAKIYKRKSVISIIILGIL